MAYGARLKAQGIRNKRRNLKAHISMPYAVFLRREPLAVNFEP